MQNNHKLFGFYLSDVTANTLFVFFNVFLIIVRILVPFTLPIRKTWKLITVNLEHLYTENLLTLR